MPGLDDVLERLVNEPEFRSRLTSDPKRALAGYDLTADDLDVLAGQLSEETGGSTPVESRTSKAALFSLLSQFSDLGGADARD